MGCCKSQNKVESESNFDELKPIISDVPKPIPPIPSEDRLEPEPEEEPEPESGAKIVESAKNDFVDLELKQYLERQSEFETELRATYESREKEYEFPALNTSRTGRSRVISPFLSSTFRDFNEERSYLVSSTFCEIERECRSKGVDFLPIDLRWGVTTQQCSSGQVIKICLDEISKCRPYFLCMIGFRNGWSLIDNLGDKLLTKTFDVAAKSYSWIYRFRDRSVTELEILHAIRSGIGNGNGNGEDGDDEDGNDLSMRCIFYLKSVHYLKEQIEGNGHSQFVDFGAAETALMELKRRIVDLKQCKVRWFNSCSNLSNEMRRDLEEIVNVDFADISNFGNLEIRKFGELVIEELRQQELFRNLLTNKSYLDINGIMANLKRFLHRNRYRKKSVFLVAGESGIGKSTVLANLSLNVTAPDTTTTATTNNPDHPTTITLYRFIGISIDSQSPLSVLKSIANELEAKYPSISTSGTSLDIDAMNSPNFSVHDAMDHLVSVIDRILSLRPEAFIVMLLDGVDRFDSKDSAEGLQFLNLIARSTLSGNPKIRIIATVRCSNAIDGDTDSKVTRRQLKELEATSSVDVLWMAPMNRQEIRLFIEQYLSRYGKVFDEKQKAMLLAAEQRVRNPLFLTILLEEMRCFGSFENLNRFLADYITDCNSIAMLFRKVLRRLAAEGQFGADLLKHTLCLLTVSRNGLLRNEMEKALEVLLNSSRIENTFPLIDCLSMLHQLTALHVVRDIDDKLAITQPAITEAVRSMYFQDEHDDEEAATESVNTDNVVIEHLEAISISFTKIYGDDINQRFIEELPHCLHTLILIEPDVAKRRNHQKRLQSVLLNLQCVPYMKRPQNLYHFHRFWNCIDCDNDHDDGQQPTKSMAERFKEELNSFELTAEIANYWRDLGIFMVDTGRYRDARYFLDRSLEHHEQHKDGNEEEETESIRFELGKLHQKEGRFEESLAEYAKCIHLLERQHKESEDEDKALLLKLTVRRSASAGVLQQLGRWKEAISHYEDSLERKRNLLGDDHHPLLAIDMVNIATIYIQNAHREDNEQLQRARTLIDSAKSIFETHFGADCLQIATVHSLTATLHQSQQRYVLALESLEKAKAIKIEKLGPSNIALVECLHNLGAVHSELDQKEEALQCFESALVLSTESQSANELILSHRDLSNFYLSNQQYALSLHHLAECRQIIQEMEGPNSWKLAESLLDSANIYAAKIGDYQSAEPLYFQILEILKSEPHRQTKESRMEMECLEGLSRCFLLHHRDYEKTNEFLDKQLLLLHGPEGDGNDHFDIEIERKRVSILHDKVAVLMAQKDYVSASSMLKELIIDLEEEAHSEMDSALRTTYNLCGIIMLQLDRQSDAITFYEKQLALSQEAKNKEDDDRFDVPSTAEILELLAILNFGNDLSESKRYFELFGKHCDDEQLKENQKWLDELKEAESLNI